MISQIFKISLMTKFMNLSQCICLHANILYQNRVGNFHLSWNHGIVKLIISKYLFACNHTYQISSSWSATRCSCEPCTANFFVLSSSQRTSFHYPEHSKDYSNGFFFVHFKLGIWCFNQLIWSFLYLGWFSFNLSFSQ